MFGLTGFASSSNERLDLVVAEHGTEGEEEPMLDP